MADIATNTLQIGGNNLILQDAAVRSSLANAYSASSTYAVGDMVLKDGQLYECNTAISTAEAWTAAHWTAVTVGGEIATVKDGFDDLDDRVTALEQGGSGSGLTEDIKQALLQIAEYHLRHRHIADLVEHFRQVAVHAGSFSRRKDNRISHKLKSSAPYYIEKAVFRETAQNS